MNRSGKEPSRRKESSNKAKDDREYFVTTDYQAIPVGELRPLTGSLSKWISAVVSHKILRSKPPTHFAIESKRLVNGDAEHVPKRIMKRFTELRSQLEPLNFSVSFYATIPSVGPFAKAVMGMSQSEGPTHFLASHVVTRINDEVMDEGAFWFATWLGDKSSILTHSPANLANPCGVVDRVFVNTNDPGVALKKHRERIMKRDCVSVPASDLFDQVKTDQERETADLLRRGVIRRATPGEVTRIRTNMRV